MMDDDLVVQAPRSDPFGMGLAAHMDSSARDACPFPPTYVEAERWLAGWDLAAVRSAEAKAHPPIAPDPAPRERPWSRTDLVVLVTLVRSGETLSGLASRLGRSKTAIRQRCAMQKLDLTEAQDGA